MLSCHDNFEANFDNYPSMLSYHQALSMASSWRRCKVKDLHVEPLDPTSPLYGHPAAFAAGTSEDAIKDTAANLGLALNVDGNIYPVRGTAYKTLTERAKINGTALPKLSRKDLANVINDTPDYKFEIGKGIVLKEGKDVSIFATGLEVSETLEAAKMLAADGIDAEVINIHTIKPIDRELIVKSVSKTGKAVTVEEHSINGGLGSAVAEVLCEEQPAKLLRIGVEDRFGESGPAVELIHKYGLDAEGIYNKVKNYMK